MNLSLRTIFGSLVNWLRKIDCRIHTVFVISYFFIILPSFLEIYPIQMILGFRVVEILQALPNWIPLGPIYKQDLKDMAATHFLVYEALYIRCCTTKKKQFRNVTFFCSKILDPKKL